MRWGNYLLGSGRLSKPETIDAFNIIPRIDFIPFDYKPCALVDGPVPIEYGQTNSMSSLVGMMIELLDLEPGHKVLDIGSGWTTALMSKIVKHDRQVLGIDRIPALVKSSHGVLTRLSIKNANLKLAQPDTAGTSGEIYGRILVSANIPGELAKPLVDQLCGGGMMVVRILSKRVRSRERHRNFTKSNK